MATHTLFGPGWFRVAVQSLAVIATTGSACPSAVIAEGVDAHAVFLRRVLAQLARGKLVEAREGRGGGYRLLRPADQITLADIFVAVAGVEQDEESPDTSCMQTGVSRLLDDIEVEAEARVLDVLRQYTLADMVQRVAPATGQPGY